MYSTKTLISGEIENYGELVMLGWLGEAQERRVGHLWYV